MQVSKQNLPFDEGESSAIGRAPGQVNGPTILRHNPLAPQHAVANHSHPADAKENNAGRLGNARCLAAKGDVIEANIVCGAGKNDGFRRAGEGNPNRHPLVEGARGCCRCPEG